MKKFLQLVFTKLAYWLKLFFSAPLTLYPEIPRPAQSQGTPKETEMDRRFKAFMERHRGHRVGGGSCVQIYRRYIKEVWKLRPLEGLGDDGGAEGLFTRYETDVGPRSRKYLERIAYDGTNLPQPGDAVIYAATATNRWGHVGIFEKPSATAGHIIIYDQHGFGSQAEAGAQSRKRSMEGLLGWLRKRA